MNKLLSSLLVMCFAYLIASIPTQAASSNVKLIINSEVINPDSPPVVINGSTLVSLNSLKELNLTLEWNSKIKIVTVTTKVNKDKLVLKVGDKVAAFGDKEIPLDSPVQLRNNRVMVPLRFISEAFQSEVNWDKDKNTIVIRSKDKMETYNTLYKGDDLVGARKIAVSLPVMGENKLSMGKEMASHQLFFPEGEALRFYHVWGNLVSYYEVKNDVSYLVWEGLESNSQPGTITKEYGKKPSAAKDIYFDLARDSNDVTYGRLKAREQLKGNADRLGTEFLIGMIQPIPNEVRTDKVTK
ncbi:copper amine oxidase N-terminal domain-containing protein [Paenibacillus sp. OAE614]|uniref:copper amine oxidase N-terminal domain-containing protein n=1 Tax=Paenibacillus sp. OAE614 TaxID=2663804 RepID=UPI00178988F6